MVRMGSNPIPGAQPNHIGGGKNALCIHRSIG
jgi:hypothetical protein